MRNTLVSDLAGMDTADPGLADIAKAMVEQGVYHGQDPANSFAKGDLIVTLDGKTAENGDSDLYPQLAVVLDDRLAFCIVGMEAGPPQFVTVSGSYKIPHASSEGSQLREYLWPKAEPLRGSRRQDYAYLEEEDKWIAVSCVTWSQAKGAYQGYVEGANSLYLVEGIAPDAYVKGIRSSKGVDEVTLEDIRCLRGDGEDGTPLSLSEYYELWEERLPGDEPELSPEEAFGLQNTACKRV